MPTPNVDGIDVSHWNPVADETLIPPLPLKTCKATEGGTFVSPTFKYFWEMFGRQGARYRGAFHWVRTDWTVKAQVDNLERALDSVGGLQVGDMIQYDWETTSKGGVPLPSPSVGFIEDWVGMGTERFGERIIVYCSDWVPNFLTWRQLHPTFPLWYANYNTGNRPQDGWAECAKFNAAVWQWSSTYKMPGFKWDPDDPTDGIDVNHVFDWATLDRLCLRNDLPHPDPIHPPPIVTPPVEEPAMPYLFRLANQGLGIRDVTGARPLNGGELEGPFAGERVWDIPAQSNWEAWVKRELARYERDLATPTTGAPQTVTVDVNVTGPTP